VNIFIRKKINDNSRVLLSTYITRRAKTKVIDNYKIEDIFPREVDKELSSRRTEVVLFSSVCGALWVKETLYKLRYRPLWSRDDDPLIRDGAAIGSIHIRGR
jgi:hypothetical protein